MSSLSFYKLGTDPQAEATRIRALYADPGVDKAVNDEFEATVLLYKSLSLEDIKTRIETRYSGNAAMAVGIIAVSEESDVGMAICGLKDYQIQMPSNTTAKYNGPNVSAWLLGQYRNKGFGKLLLAHSADQVFARTQSDEEPDWFRKRIWTSVSTVNIPSQKACRGAGFIEVATQADDPSRLIYELEASN